MNKWQQLYAPTVRKLNIWEISPRAKAVGIEIANNSLAVGLPEVELWQEELVVMTGYAKACVTKAVDELIAAGVLQRRGAKGKPRIYRLLTNAELLEPERVIDEATARKVRAAVQARNAVRLPGDDPGGQAVLLRTTEEALRDDLAAGSAERALADNAEEIDAWTPRQIAEAARRSMEEADRVSSQATRPCEFPPRQLDRVSSQATRGANYSRVPAHERQTFETCKRQTSETFGQTVAVATEGRRSLSALDDSQVQHALKLVEQASAAKAEDRRDFKQWLRKWRTRCRAEPELVCEYASEELANQRIGKGAESAPRWIFRMAQKAAKGFGRALKIL